MAPWFTNTDRWTPNMEWWNFILKISKYSFSEKAREREHDWCILVLLSNSAFPFWNLSWLQDLHILVDENHFWTPNMKGWNLILQISYTWIWILKQNTSPSHRRVPVITIFFSNSFYCAMRRSKHCPVLLDGLNFGYLLQYEGRCNHFFSLSQKSEFKNSHFNIGDFLALYM